jgi:hypothetical protein
MEVAPISAIDRSNYRVVISPFHAQYNQTHDVKVKSLEGLYVIKISLRKQKGRTNWVVPLYTYAVEARWAIEKAAPVVDDPLHCPPVCARA